MPPITTSKELNLPPSLLDRLFDDDPDVKEDPLGPVLATRAIRQLKAAVRRDLEAVLNSRAYVGVLPGDAPELRKSILTFGLPDFTGLLISTTEGYDKIGRTVEDVLNRCEPRLKNIRVTMLSPDQVNLRSVRFTIDALLRVEPTPEPIRFDTLLQLHNGEYQVRDEG